MSDGRIFVLLGLPPLLRRLQSPALCDTFDVVLLGLYHRWINILAIYLVSEGAFYVFAFVVMSQADIDAFVESARNNTLTPEGVMLAVVTRGISVNGAYSILRSTALHWAVDNKRPEVVVALVAAGADANVKNSDGETSVWVGACNGTADILLQLLINSGGSVNEGDADEGQTPLIALVRWNYDDLAAQLKVLLACPELDLDAQYNGNTAGEWAAKEGYSQMAVAITKERARRERWGALRAYWVAATCADCGLVQFVKAEH